MFSPPLLVGYSVYWLPPLRVALLGVGACLASLCSDVLRGGGAYLHLWGSSWVVLRSALYQAAQFIPK